MRAALDEALDRFVAAHPDGSWEVKAESDDELEVDVWGPDPQRNAEETYLGRWRVPAEGEPERLDYYLVPDDPAGTVFDPYSPTFGPLMAAIQEGEFERAASLLTALANPGKRIAVVRYDVTGFSDAEVGKLLLEASVQGEASAAEPEHDDPGHPDAHGVESEVVGDAA